MAQQKYRAAVDPRADTDNWLIQAVIADDAYMRVRVAACAARLGCAENAGIDPDDWALQWRRVWAAAPGWWQAWKSNVDGGGTDPGANGAVITDAMIDSQVQQMMPFTRVADHAPVPVPAG
jgi:phage-related tail fiber protein